MPIDTTVITALSKGYDELRPPKVKTPGCEYVYYAQEPLDVPIWQFRPLPQFPAQPPWFAPKHVKVFPWRYCLSPRSVWVDASIEIIGSLADILQRYLVTADIAAYRHMSRNCAYREAVVCSALKKDSPEVIRKQMESYKSRRFPQNAGLICGGVLFREHTDKVNRLSTGWWAEIIKHSHRDQLSFNYVCWRLGIKYNILPGQLYGKNARFKVHPKHKAQLQTA